MALSLPFPLIAAIAVASAIAFPSAAQEFGCRSNGSFHVNAIEQTEDAGTIFAVRVGKTGQKPACPKRIKDADFVVGKAGDPLWFEALQANYLVMTRSTGPQGDVVIYDLARRDYALDVPADEVAVDATAATYWERIDQGTPKNCKEFARYRKDGLGAAIAAETRFDFATGKTARTGAQRCDAIQ